MLKVLVHAVTPVLLFFSWNDTESLGIFVLSDPVYQLRMLDERNGTFRGMRIGREIEIQGENLLQFYFDHHKSHTNLRLNPGPRNVKLGTTILYIIQKKKKSTTAAQYTSVISRQFCRRRSCNR
jgi:hypothetical protein